MLFQCLYSDYSSDSSSSSEDAPLVPSSSSPPASSVSSVEPLPGVVVVVEPTAPPVLYKGAKQSLISCSVGVDPLLPSSAFDISSSEASPPNRHSINCWKFSPSSAAPVPVEEPVFGELLPGLDGVSNVG